MSFHERPVEKLKPSRPARTRPCLPGLRRPARVVGYLAAGTGVVAAGQVIATLVVG